jgi:SAM-dependent methyltransferase
MGWVTRNIPAPIVGAIRRLMRTATGEPQVGTLAFGDLRRTTPITRDFGVSRGGAVDRYYIEGFLDRHRADVRGRVLEVGEDAYTRRFGGTNVAQADVLHGSAANRRATIVADLADAPHVPDETFDCIVLTQVLQLLYRPDAAVATLRRILRPGGVLLMTVPGITQIAVNYEWPWYWSFTSLSVRRLLHEAFGADQVQCESQGNVLTATAHLYGVSAAELTPAELDHVDPDYQVIITARAVRGG